MRLFLFSYRQLIVVKKAYKNRAILETQGIKHSSSSAPLRVISGLVFFRVPPCVPWTPFFPWHPLRLCVKKNEKIPTFSGFIKAKTTLLPLIGGIRGEFTLTEGET